MRSFLLYMTHNSVLFCNIENNLKFSENSNIFIFFIKKMKNFSLNFGLMLNKTSLMVFIIFLGQLGYIVMSDSKKNQNNYFLKKIEKKEENLLLFLVAKSEKKR